MQIGQKVLRLDSVDSTNNYVANLLRKGDLTNGTVILADEQFAGRGQREAKWVSNPSDNLITSFFLGEVNLSVNDQFVLTQMVSLGILHFLKKQDVEAKIKWPNDILVGNRKIAGILIENQLRGSAVQSSIVGVGLNVNQKEFDGFNATSISLEKGKFCSVQELLFSFIHSMNALFEKYRYDFQELREEYEKFLFRKGEKFSFQDATGDFFGVIQGTDVQGKLIILKENGTEMRYVLKEVSFLLEE